MIFRDATNNDIETIQELLRNSDLPFQDIQSYIMNFSVIVENHEIIGTGGFEHYGDVALLRSVAITQPFQGNSIGEKIVNHLISKASGLGVNKLFLLTQTADGYFENHGFIKVNRETAPDIIKQTQQYSELCPMSASLMSKEL